MTLSVRMRTIYMYVVIKVSSMYMYMYYYPALDLYSIMSSSIMILTIYTTHTFRHMY